MEPRKDHDRQEDDEMLIPSRTVCEFAPPPRVDGSTNPSERRARLFRAVLESEMKVRYEQANQESKILFSSSVDADRGLRFLFPDDLGLSALEERCLRVQKFARIQSPVRLFDETGRLLPFASRVIDELRPRLQYARAGRVGFGQIRFQALRAHLIGAFLEGLKRGIVPLACLYTFCRVSDLRANFWATGLFSRSGSVRDADLVRLLERSFEEKGLAFLQEDGSLSDAAVELLDEVRMHILCRSGPEAQKLLDAFDDFEKSAACLAA